MAYQMTADDVKRAMDGGWTIQQLTTLTDFIDMLEDYGVDAVEELLGSETMGRMRAAFQVEPMAPPGR